MKETRERNEEPRATALASGGVVGVLAAAAVIAGGTQAYAEVVRFDNPAHADPGHFHWPVETPPGAKGLDLVLPASAQPITDVVASAVSHKIAFGYGWVGTSTGSTAELQVGGYSNYFVVGVGAGDLIPSGANWGNRGYTYYPGYGYTELPEGTPTYLGVRFDLGGGFQYGWIGGVRTGVEFETFAWGYETIPGVPIAAGVPAPGTLALLAFGAATGLTRKRRTPTTPTR